MKLSVFLITLFFLLKIAPVPAQTYMVKKIPGKVMQITGRGDNPAWKKAVNLTDFSYPWEKEKAPATSFSALWDGDWLYCLYQAKDDSVITVINKNDKLEIGACDRVEIFMMRDSTMLPYYYCLEMDATARVLDYRASFYRKMDYSWKWPGDQFIIKTAAVPGGYIVEIAISIQSLTELGLLQNKQLLAGLFRAERKSMKEGTAGLHWISWVKPNSAKPDFHIPSAFGILALE
ncbi:hypothetical protein A3860_15215 [Niastella vici]|uniref:Carbohydrate-binding domain-containing protein n=1 Tax=Niastella vici TaxID=1703345 RepID=A0A1V9G5S7_9BACT|nr:carbohydrate-binding family 9-like protein [Niastella vici]OQP65937.1 hypothetical protein A3860_15215 [Niastella vici]